MQNTKELEEALEALGLEGTGKTPTKSPGCQWMPVTNHPLLQVYQETPSKVCIHSTFC